MTSDTRTTDDIEKHIVDERAQMSDTINNLQKKFSVDAIMGDLGAMFRNQGGDVGRAVSQTVARNPAAVVLVGVGLAWLFIGRGQNPAAGSADDPWDDVAYSNGKRESYGAWDRSASTGQSVGDQTAERDRYWYGNDQMARASRGLGSNGTTPGKGWGQSGDAPTGVMGAVQGAVRTVSDAASSVAGSLGNAASDLTDRLSHGLEDLSEEARTRVVAARRAALDARQASAAAVKKGSRVASDFFADQPLVVGALAVALGAAMGGVLPRSKIEDDTLGSSSDQLFSDAQALFRTERDKALAAVRMAATDVKGEIKDVGEELADLLPEGKSVGEVIVDRAADAATRVFNRATGDVDQSGSDKSQS